MKNLLLSSLILITFLSSSCSKSDKGEKYFAIDNLELRDGKLMDKDACFEFVFPLNFTVVDGSIVTIENEVEFYTELKELYNDKGVVVEGTGLVYPFDVILGDKQFTINDDGEMKKTKDFCDVKKDCFYLVYPLSYTMPDEKIITVENDDEFWNTIKDWYTQNPDVEAKPILIYPVDIRYVDGKVVKANDEEALIKYKEKCKG